MNKDELLKELHQKVDAWFEEKPQRPIAQFMLDTMVPYLDCVTPAKKATREDVEEYLTGISSPVISAIYTMINFAYLNTEHKSTSEAFQILCGLIDVFYKRVEFLNNE